MILRAITTEGNHSGLMSGADSLRISSKILGGVNISADGTNAATVVVRKDGPEGEIIFHQITKSPLFVVGPIQAANICYCNVTGTGALAQFYEWAN